MAKFLTHKQHRQMFREELTKWFIKLAKMRADQLDKLDDAKVPLIARGIVAAMRMYVSTGEDKYIKYLLDQVIGKPVESLEVTGKDGGPVESVCDFRRMSTEDLEKILNGGNHDDKK